MSDKQPPTSNALAGNSRIMGLKFMQRRQPKQQQQQSTATTAAAAPGAASSSTAPATSEQEWTLEAADSAPAAAGGPRVVYEADALASDDSNALVSFRAGRRSYGSYNPRLEKRLDEIRAGQRAAREAAAAEAKAAAERAEREAEHAELMAKEEEAEAAEKASAMEMAEAFRAKYEKYAGVCLETEGFPDAIHHPNWPTVVLRPGETFRHRTLYSFSARAV